MTAGVTWIQQRRIRRAVGCAVLAGGVGIMLPTSSTPAGAAPVPVIIRAADGELAQARALVEGLGGTIEHQVGLINGFIGELPGDRVDDLLAHKSEILSVAPNAPVQLAGATYDAGADPNSAFNAGQVTNARSAWGKGYTGKGIGIAVLDTGVTGVKGLDQPGKIVYGPDLTPDSLDPTTVNVDGYGHGTFMAGLIAGNDNVGDAKTLASSKTGYLGVAPDARIISVKVGDKSGNTVVGAVIMGLDWVVQHAKDPDKNIRVVNLSFSTNSSQTYLLDPLAFAAERAWFAGLTVVTSAGNSGDTTGRMTMPAIDPFVIAVGADHTMGTLSTSDDDVPTFSSKGDGLRNPDLIAPGVSLQGLRVPGSYADKNFPSAAFGDRFFRGSGTSQATAITSGAAALLLSQRPYLKPDQIKALLTQNAARLPSADTQAQGSGLLDVAKSMKAGDPWTLQLFWKSSGLGSLLASGGSWTGSTWSNRGNTWSGSTWSGSTWSGSTWSGSTWSGSTWSGSTWSGSTWSTGGWE